MATFFPHLYEYGQIMDLLKENEKKNKKDLQSRKRLAAFDRKIKKFKTEALSTVLLTYEKCNQSNDIKLLIYLEQKALRLRESDYDFIKFNSFTLEDILKERTQLANAEYYSKPLEWPLNHETLSTQYNLITGKAVRYWFIIDAVLCIEILKVLPFFTQLNLSDQKCLLNASTIQNILLTSAYYSAVAFCDVLYLPDGHMPSKYPKLHENQEAIFERVVGPIKRIQMTKEEYVLLKIIIFCSSKSDGISDSGKTLLKTEFHRYSRLLLKHLQAKYGDAPGAVRYSQILSVMEAMIYFAQKGKELYVYNSALQFSGPMSQLIEEIVL